MTDDSETNIIQLPAIPPLRPLTKLESRLIEHSEIIRNYKPEKDDIAFHHSIFCQTALPHRSTSERILQRQNGHVSLRVEAGVAMHPQTQEWVNLPMPSGIKSRLILIHMDSFAISHNTPEIDMGDSMTAFLKGLQGYSPNGKELTAFKQHAAAITGALFRFGTAKNKQSAHQVDTKIVTSFDMWFPKDPNQRTLWPTFVRLSADYYNTLKIHAVPLDRRALAALQHSALALDIYKWLAQRLCRIDADDYSFIPWPEISLQFGSPYKRLRAFRDVFLETLRTVQAEYPRANVTADGKGVRLRFSEPPVPKLTAV